MSTTLSEGLDFFLRLCVPYAVIFVFFLLNMVSSLSPLTTKVDVPLILMCLYYWAVYRPGLIPPLFVFVLGILVDLLSGLPIGLSAFTFVFMRWVVVGQRNFLIGQPFIVVWLGYIMASFVAIWLQWAVIGGIRFSWTPVTPIMLTIISGAFLFPFVSLILNLSHKVLPELRDQYSAVK